MSLIIGGIVRSKVAMFADSAIAPKVISVPCLKLIVGWVGYFNRSPLAISYPTEPEYLNPNEHADYSGIDASIETFIKHINSHDHIHPNGNQALIFVAACHDDARRIMVFESTGGKGDWPTVGAVLPPLFVAGYLEPFGIAGAYAPLTEPVFSVSALADLGLHKIRHGNDWLRNHGKNSIIHPPLMGYMHSRKGLTEVQRG